jgi:protease I
MAGELNGRRVAILAADGVERVELERPRQALEEAGARTVVVSIKSGEILARDHDLEDAGTFAVDQLVGSSSGTSSGRASPWPRSATVRGTSSRPTSRVAVG